MLNETENKGVFEFDAPSHHQEHLCKYCGQPSDIDPSDQSPPVDYCHDTDHQL